MTTLNGAAKLLAYIRKAETGETDLNEQYRTIIRHKQGELPKPLTQYTVDELLAAQVGWGKKWKSSAAGAYQIIRKTLAGLKAGQKLTGKEKFTPELQDRLAIALLRGRGWDKAVAGTMSPATFALALAKEWASLPVLQAMQGASRKVKRGESYYAGDGLNASLVKAEEFERVLLDALKAAKAPQPAPRPTIPSEPETPATDEPVAEPQYQGIDFGKVAIAIGIIVAIIAVAGFFF